MFESIGHLLPQLPHLVQQVGNLALIPSSTGLEVVGNQITSIFGMVSPMVFPLVTQLGKLIEGVGSQPETNCKILRAGGLIDVCETAVAKNLPTKLKTLAGYVCLGAGLLAFITTCIYVNATTKIPKTKGPFSAS